MSKATKRFHIGNIRIGDWWVGIHFERVLQNLFKQRTESGDILLQPAVSKVADGIDQILAQWVVLEPIFDAAVSDDGQSSADKAKAEAMQIRDDLRQIQTITDIPQHLSEFRFAEDDNRNKFYHEFIIIIFTSFSDGKLSLVEFTSIGSRLATWIRDGR